MALQPPVEPMLAQARDTRPGPRALPGGLAYEPKFDGYPALVFTPGTKPGPVRVQLRRGGLVQARFPELVTAGAHLPEGLVLDGELVVWTGHQMSCEALQRRAASTGARAERLAERLPAHFIAFDVLQADGEERLRVPYAERRVRLEGTDPSGPRPTALSSANSRRRGVSGWVGRTRAGRAGAASFHQAGAGRPAPGHRPRPSAGSR